MRDVSLEEEGTIRHNLMARVLRGGFDHLIAEYIAEKDRADRYLDAALMYRIPSP